MFTKALFSGSTELARIWCKAIPKVRQKDEITEGLQLTKINNVQSKVEWLSETYRKFRVKEIREKIEQSRHCHRCVKEGKDMTQYIIVVTEKHVEERNPDEKQE